MSTKIDIDFVIRYQCTNDDGTVGVWSSNNTISFDSNESLDYNKDDNSKTKLINDFSRCYDKDSNFKILNVEAVPNKFIDWDLMERINAIRQMCELGRKVRANTKIRNRQPLKKAYVAFSNRDVQNYMLYLDSRDRSFEETLEDELNIQDVEFIDDNVAKRIFNFNLKPNFRVLGPKGFGKQAQSIKTALVAMTADQKNEVHSSLKNGETITINDVPLTISDFEIEFATKEGFSSSSNKVGAIVLDTNLTENLLDLGFVAEFRAAAQMLRREAKLNLTDKITLDIFCENKRSEILEKNLSVYNKKLMKDLLATQMNFHSLDKVDQTKFQRLFFDGETLKTNQQVNELFKQDKLSYDDLSDEKFFVDLAVAK